jgi:hypothetical protein
MIRFDARGWRLIRFADGRGRFRADLNQEKQMKPYEEHILRQFENPTAQQELRGFGPAGVDWVARTRATLDVLLPRLGGIANTIVEVIPRRLSAIPALMNGIRAGGDLVVRLRDAELTAWYESLRTNSELAAQIIAQFESQQVSAEIQRFLTGESGLGDVARANGNSIYPDLWLIGRDYTMLPRQRRTAPIEGPCLRGERPSNVPDGCELKTNRGDRVKVDAHGAHPGLHVAVTWDLRDLAVVITGVWGAYVRIADHRESGRNVAVTTVKYSFGHDLFVSLI